MHQHWAERLSKDHTTENPPLTAGETETRPVSTGRTELHSRPGDHSSVQPSPLYENPCYTTLESTLELWVTLQLQAIMSNSRWGTCVLLAKTELDSLSGPWHGQWSPASISPATSLMWKASFQVGTPLTMIPFGSILSVRSLTLTWVILQHLRKVPGKSPGRTGKIATSSGQPRFPLTQKGKAHCPLHWI